MLERLRVPAPPALAPTSAQISKTIAAPPLDVLAHPRGPTAAGLFDWLFAGVLGHPSGAVAGWRERVSGRLSDEYPEISGYYLSAAVFAHATDRDAVARVADWLSARVEGNELASRRVDGPAIYNFDLGIVAAGLIKYGVRTGRQRPVAAGIRAACSLRDQLREIGYLPPFHPGAGRASARPPTWSTVGTLHLAKTVQSLLLAAELGVDGMREAAHMLIARTRREFGLTSDSLRESDGQINLHAACYALEGFWIWNAAEHAPLHDELLERSLAEIASYRLETGGLPRNAPGGATREQCDVLAQVVRLAALLGRTAMIQTSIDRLREVALRTEAGWAMPYQPQSPDVHENAWATMFGAQALALVDDAPDLEWWELI